MGWLCRNWTEKNLDLLFSVLFVLGHGFAYAFDLWLVETGRTSISMRTWIQTELHPTLQGAGILAYIGVALLVRRHGWMIFLAGTMTGHLFFHT